MELDTIILFNIHNDNIRLLEILRNDPKIENLVINVTYGLLENKDTAKIISQYMDNLPFTIKTISIMINSHYSRYGLPPLNKITIDNLPFSVKKIFVNNLCELNIRKIPFGCEIIFIKNIYLPKQYDCFRNKMNDSNLNLRLEKPNEYDSYLSCLTSNFDEEEIPKLN